MGTRNLTCAVLNGEYKIAQYGQWDGHPEGQGMIILEFISVPENLASLKEALPRCRFLDPENNKKDAEFIENYNERCPKFMGEEDGRTPEEQSWFSRFASRDIGGRILEHVARTKEGEILLQDSLNFAGNSRSCEWAYVVDFDRGVFEVYTGFSKEPVPEGERFHSFKTDDYIFNGQDGSEYSYYQVKFVCEFNLNNLPTPEVFVKTISFILND